MGILTWPSAAIVALGIALATCSLAETHLNADDVQPARPYDGPLPTRDELLSPDGLERYESLSRDILRSSSSTVMERIRGQMQSSAAPVNDEHTDEGLRELPLNVQATVFVSSSMGEASLSSLFQQYGGRADVQFVFRGVPPQLNVPEFGQWILKLQQHSRTGTVAVILDPELFANAGITIVPSLVVEGSGSVADERFSITAVGIHDVDWVYGKFLSGETTIPARTAFPIAEEDLRDRAAREAMVVASQLGLDNAERVKRFWDNASRKLKGLNIVDATAIRERELHFQFRAPRDLTDADGRILAFEGEIIEARDVAPFDRRIIVFNPKNPEEVEFVAAQLLESVGGVSKTVLVASQVPSSSIAGRPWAGLEQLVLRFGRKVFLLDEHMARNFQIEATPSIVAPRYRDDHINPEVWVMEIPVTGGAK